MNLPILDPILDIDWEELYTKYDWVRDMELTPQDELWHGEGNVYVHTKMVMNELLNDVDFQSLNDLDKLILANAVLFHDVEKRSTTKVEMIDGIERIVSPYHAKKGAKTTQNILYADFNVSFDVRQQIVNLVRYHGFPVWFLNKKDIEKELKLLSTKVNTKLLYILSKCDMKGRISTTKDDHLLSIDLLKEYCIEYDCFGVEYNFPHQTSIYEYRNKQDSYSDYVPYHLDKFKVYFMCGLAGSGKDTYIQTHLSNLKMISLDEIRRSNKLETHSKENLSKVINIAKNECRVALRAKQSFVFNATSLTKDIRRKWISLFMEYGAVVETIYIEVPYKTLIKQNQNRKFVVNDKVLSNMIKKLEVPTLEETNYLTLEIKN